MTSLLNCIKMDDGVVHGKVVYEQDSVYINTFNSEDGFLTPGKLSVTEKPHGVFIEWIQTEDCYDTFEQVHEWDVVNETVGFSTSGTSNGSLSTTNGKCAPTPRIRPVQFDLDDVKSIQYCGRDQNSAFITFFQKDGTTHPRMDFHKGKVERLVATLEKYIRIKRSKVEKNLWLVVPPNADALEKSLHELQISRRSRFAMDPYTVTMSGFSKVTKFLYDCMIVEPSPSSRPSSEIEEILHDSLPRLEINPADAGFELITQKDLIPRPDVSRGSPLTAEEWANFVNPDGVIAEVDLLKEKIFRGGVSSTIRKDVWKFLLDYFDYNSSYEARKESRKEKIDEYYRMKLQWKTISSVQEKRFSALRDRKSLIDKDVSRTDRTHSFFEGSNNENLQVLNDVLMTYCMYNFDLGYVQGMSDLLSPILVVMETEVDAFWCFAGLMEKVCHNFEMDQQGMKTQLHQLFSILHFMDPKLCDYLESHESGNLFFCFRWLLILFKREFSFPDVMKLWEVLWTGLPCKNFHLLFCLAILDTEKDILMENKFGFTEILKHINDISQHIRLDENLAKAEAMYIQLASCRYLPQTIQDILGIEIQPEDVAAAEGEMNNEKPTEVMASNNKSPQSNTSSMETSSIELLNDCDVETHYRMTMDFNI